MGGVHVLTNVHREYRGSTYKAGIQRGAYIASRASVQMGGTYVTGNGRSTYKVSTE